MIESRIYKKETITEWMYYVTLHNEEWCCKFGYRAVTLFKSNSRDLSTPIFFITCYKFIKIYLVQRRELLRCRSTRSINTLEWRKLLHPTFARLRHALAATWVFTSTKSRVLRINFLSVLRATSRGTMRTNVKRRMYAEVFLHRANRR